MDLKKLSKDNIPVNEALAHFSDSFLTGSAFKVLKASDHANIQTYAATRPIGKGFPQSVASGDPTSTGMVLWTRVDISLESGFSNEEIDKEVIHWLKKMDDQNSSPLAEAVDRGKFVMFQVSRTSDFSSIELEGFSPIWRDHDNVVRIDLNGILDANGTYYYRFMTKSGLVSKTGKCKTLPQEGSDHSTATIGYISCQDYTNGYFNALAHFADEEMNFFLHLGDYIYEAVGNADYQAKNKARNIHLPSGKDKATALEDYRQLYKVYRTDTDLQKLHEKHAMVATWDDHEFANDAYHPAVAPDDSLEPDPERRFFANQAWIEYMPSRVFLQAGASSADSLKFYRSIEIGNLATLFITDERFYRDSHPCGEKELERYFTEGCENMHSTERSMLGKKQKEWFLDGLRNSNSLWTIWGNQVQITQLKFLGRYINLDAWDGFPHERETITKTILDEGVQNFIALTGDFHAFEASYLQEGYSRNGKKVGVELMVGSVTSSNINEMIQKNLNQIIDFSSPLPMAAALEIIGKSTPDVISKNMVPTKSIFEEIQNVIKIENPWIELFDSTSHGYALLELSKTNAVWKAYAVNTIEKPGASNFLLLQCEIPEGEVKIEVKEKNSFFG